MKHLLVVILTIALIVSTPLVAFSSNSGATDTKVETSSTKPIANDDHVIVKLKDNASSAPLKGLYQSKELIKGGAYDIEVKDGKDTEEVIEKLEDDPKVEYAEPDYLRSVSVTPNDYYWSIQWGLSKIKAPAGWDQHTGSPSIIVAVVDTGVDTAHPDLADKIVAGYDYVNNDNDPMDDHGHGTHAAGIAAASTNNGIGVAGVGWNVKIMPMKVLSGTGNGYDSWVASGIRGAVDRGAHVINLSLGGAGFSQTLKDATDYAIANNVVVVAAAGNTGSATINYPAGNPNVIGVGATDSSDKIASFSTYNSTVDVSAPGVNIASTYWNSGQHAYAYMSGTSMAAPHVAGLVGLVKSKWSTYTVSQVADRIQSYSDDLGSPGRDDYYGYGRINAQRALASAASTNVSVSTSASRKKIRTGKTVVIKGMVRPTKSGTVVIRYKKTINKKVRVRKNGRLVIRTRKVTTGWRTAKRTRLNGSSVYAARIRLNSQARYVFAAKYGSFSSRGMVVYAVGKKIKRKARKLVSINVSGKRVKLGRKIKISGRRLKGKGKVTVVIKYKLGKSRWRTAKRFRIKGRNYKAFVRPHKPGKYVFSVKVGKRTSPNKAVYFIGR